MRTVPRLLASNRYSVTHCPRPSLPPLHYESSRVWIEDGVEIVTVCVCVSGGNCRRVECQNWRSTSHYVNTSFRCAGRAVPASQPFNLLNESVAASIFSPHRLPAHGAACCYRWRGWSVGREREFRKNG